MNKTDIRNLKFRYCLWFYKTAKEELDKVERKFTQLEIDRLILGELKKAKAKNDISGFIADFEKYIGDKEAAGRTAKFNGNALKPEYEFLLLKLAAIEKAIVKKFGKPELSRIKRLYEAEMSERILKSREH